MPTWLWWLAGASGVVCAFVLVLGVYRWWFRRDDDDIYGGLLDVPPEAPEDEARRRQV